VAADAVQLGGHCLGPARAHPSRDIPAARAHLEAAIRAAEALGSPHLIALSNLAEVLRAEHDLDSARSGFEDVVRRSRRTGDKYALAAAILGLASLAADLGDWHRAAVLYGAEHALMDQIGAQWNPFDARPARESLDQARAALGDSNSSRPTPAAEYSASTRPSTSPSGKAAQPRNRPYRATQITLIPARQRHPPWRPGLPTIR